MKLSLHLGFPPKMTEGGGTGRHAGELNSKLKVLLQRPQGSVPWSSRHVKHFKIIRIPDLNSLNFDVFNIYFTA